MTLSDYSFDLPEELIAQEPPAVRGASRLMVLDRETGAVADHRFADLPALLRAGDLLVVNDSKVFAARLLGRRRPGGGAAECLLVRRLEQRDDGEYWEALVHPGQRLKEGSRIECGEPPARIHVEVRERRFHGRRVVRVWTDGPLLATLVDAIGHVPLPPYIHRADAPADRERYQTVYARVRGSIAAPTAGLHFTPEILEAIERRGVERTAITLHVGYGTFQPIRSDDVDAHRMEPESYEVSPEAAAAISRARRDGRRVIAVGTTTTRTLESLRMTEAGAVVPGIGETTLFIHPGHRFRVVSGLITNFHLPRSSLLLLVCALASREMVLAAYDHARRAGYRFYSYGDAMLVA